MNVTPESLSNDPAVFLHGLSVEGARFQLMDRDGFFKSVFLDNRISHGGRQAFQLPLESVLSAFHGPAPAERPLCFIFHVAQCGSTLLARALDLPGRDLVLREPAALRGLGTIAGGGERDRKTEGQLHRLLPLALSLLGKRWEPDAPVIVKANVPVNFIARDILELEPSAPALLLHFPIAAYVAAVMRTPGHEAWVESIFEEMRLAESVWAAGAIPRSTAERTACLWFAQMKLFETLPGAFANVRSLSASQFFDSPAPTIAAAARLFGLTLGEDEGEAIVAGDLFATYSKNPALDYDSEVRAAREAEARRRLAAQIEEAVQWACAARDRHGLTEALDAPLIGNPVPLLS